MIVEIVISALLAGFLGFLAGRRWEKGGREVDAAIREAIGEKRAGRSGTVRLNTIKIRR
jgi:hypothetical protein